MIINIRRGVFGDMMRNGDILGACNVLEYFRLLNKNPEIKFFLEDDCYQNSDYTIKFLQFIKEHTNYFSEIRGVENLNRDDINVWDYRSVAGDLVKIDNSSYDKDKIVCIFPIFDAPYNLYRNWSVNLTHHILQKYISKYPEYKIIMGVSDKLKEFVESEFAGYNIIFSYDLIDNLKYICQCEVFVGGDTGTSHFAGSLTNPAKNDYYYASEEWFHTFPLHFNENGNMILYSKYGCNL